MTPAPCLRRVLRLGRAGVITGYRAEVDNDAIGRGFEVIVAVEIRLNGADTVKAFEEAVLSLDEITGARRLFGLPDYYLRVNVPDVAAGERLTTETLTRLPSAGRVTSHQSMKFIKQPIETTADRCQPELPVPLRPRQNESNGSRPL